ncbi:MAG TPA: hypothetical protein VFR23_18130 [Jiangellaceae bacterium]|nr:hypothetical protein [Jiangellaceae bacterium]
MAWTDSRIYRQFVADALADTAAFKLGGTDVFKAALYGTGATPDRDATAANSAYSATAWHGAAEIIDSTGGGTDWPAGGVSLGTETLTTPSTGVVMLDAPDTASGATADIAAAFGCLVYDDTLATPVADQGVCFNYFGGSNSVTNGTFTVVWHANGVMRITV